MSSSRSPCRPATRCGRCPVCSSRRTPRATGRISTIAATRSSATTAGASWRASRCATWWRRRAGSDEPRPRREKRGERRTRGDDEERNVKMSVRPYLAAALVTTSWLVHQIAVAQDYPARPIHWIVPVPPGATTDILSRVIGAKMGEAWNQQVIVDNRSGGAFVVGTDLIAKANPDGYTIGILLTPHVVNPFVMKNLPYDSVKDFQPITQVVFVPGVMVANANLPANNLKEVIALAKARPGQLNFG